MPKIPEFQRRKLASEVVGTPGIDPSGAQIGQSVAGFFNNVTNTAANMLTRVKEANDQSILAKTTTDLQVSFESAFNEHKEAFSDDPLNQTDKLKERLRKELTTVASGIKSPVVRQSLQRFGEGLVGSKLLKEMGLAL